MSADGKLRAWVLFGPKGDPRQVFGSEVRTTAYADATGQHLVPMVPASELTALREVLGDTPERPTLEEPWEYTTLRDAYEELADRIEAALAATENAP